HAFPTRHSSDLSWRWRQGRKMALLRVREPKWIETGRRIRVVAGLQSAGTHPGEGLLTQGGLAARECIMGRIVTAGKGGIIQAWGRWASYSAVGSQRSSPRTPR